MKKSGKIVALLVLILGAAFAWFRISNSNPKIAQPLTAVKWDNFYNEDNIKFYYDDKEVDDYKVLNKQYNLQSLVKNSKDDIEKASEVMKWTGQNLKFSKKAIIPDSDAKEIISICKHGGKVSDKEYTLVFNQVALSIGLDSRIGQFKAKSSEKKEYSYLYINEVWINKYNKWVLFDPVNKCYMVDKNNVPLSAVEVINQGIDKIKTDNGNYKYKKIKDSFYSYTIKVDNCKYSIRNINSKITYIKEGELPELKDSKGYITPTIFVNKDLLFKISPKAKYKERETDKVPTLILSKKDEKEDKKNELNFFGGVFKNSYMIDEYYVSINGSKWAKVNRYFDIKLTDGETNIRISEDEKTVEREITLKYVSKQDKRK